MEFCTVINCMDGRVQLPVNEYLRKRFNVNYVDSITEAGPNRVILDVENKSAVQSIINKLDISVHKHKSVGIAIAGHYDCAGNPVEYEEKVDQIKSSVKFIKSKYNDLDVIGLWVDENWEVHEIED